MESEKRFSELDTETSSRRAGAECRALASPSQAGAISLCYTFSVFALSVRFYCASFFMAPVFGDSHSRGRVAWWVGVGSGVSRDRAHIPAFLLPACATMRLSESQFPHLQNGAESAALREPGAGQPTQGGQRPALPSLAHNTLPLSEYLLACEGDGPER